MNASKKRVASLLAVPLFLLVLFLLFRSVSAFTYTCGTGGIVIKTAPWYCNNIEGALSSIWYAWFPYVLLAVFVSFSVAGLIFSLGIALRNERIRNFGVGEIYEATATAIIAIAFLFLAGTVFGILPAVVTGPVDPYSFALSYISSNIQATQSPAKALYNVAMIDEFYGSVDLDVSAGPITNATAAFFTQASNSIMIYFSIPARAVMYLLADGLLALNLQFYLIIFFMETAIPVFLIPGIIFRSLFPTRNLGGIMIAISIAFYLIMPTLFSLAYYFTNSGLLQSLNAYTQQLNNNAQGTGAESNANSQSGLLVQNVQGLESTMGPYWLSILFYPALIAAISYESIKIIAEFIGGATKTTGKLRAI